MPESSVYTRRGFVKFGLGSLLLPLESGGAEAPDASALVTPSQTEGPFFPVRDQDDHDIDLTSVKGSPNRASGEVIQVSGRVLSTRLTPIANAVIYIWQANTHGRYAHDADSNRAPLDKHFQGWAKFETNSDGFYTFKTIKPGPYPVDGRWTRPPHIHFKVIKPGFRELTTQMYFHGHPLNGIDRLLQRHAAEERKKLVVRFDHGERGEPKSGEFNIVLDVAM